MRFFFIFSGLMLGASLWYVSRRLFGNAGGYTALALYVLSPMLVERASTIHPAIVAAWGAFGLIFTSMAVAHTLYAPREVILWNWRRILLLGVSIAFALGSQFSRVLLFPLAAGLPAVSGAGTPGSSPGNSGRRMRGCPGDPCRHLFLPPRNLGRLAGS